MSDNVYRKATNTLELFSGRIADAYTKAQTDAKFGEINTQLQDKADASSLSAVATTGDYSDLNGKPSLATVATSGNYTDLNGKPTLGTAAAKNATNSITSGGADLPTSGAIYSTNVTRVKQINWYANRYLVRSGNIVTVCGTPNGWVTSRTLSVPVGFRPAYNMDMVPTNNGSGGLTLSSYSGGSFTCTSTGYWQVMSGVSWYTSDAFPS